MEFTSDKVLNVKTFFSPKLKKMCGVKYSLPFTIGIDHKSAPYVHNFLAKIKRLFKVDADLVCLDEKKMCIIPEGEDSELFAFYDSVTVYCLSEVMENEGESSSPQLAVEEPQPPKLVPSTSTPFNSTQIDEPVVDNSSRTRREHTLGELLADLRSNSANYSDDHDSLVAPAKRKRVRKHKKRKHEPDDIDQTEKPIEPSHQEFSFDQGLKPNHVRFPETETQEDSCTLGLNGQNGVESQGGDSEVCTQEYPMPSELLTGLGQALTNGDGKTPIEQDLKNLFTLRAVHGGPPVFVKATPPKDRDI